MKDPQERISTTDELLTRLGLERAFVPTFSNFNVQNPTDDSKTPQLLEEDIHVGLNSRSVEGTASGAAKQNTPKNPPKNNSNDDSELVIPLNTYHQAEPKSPLENEEPIAKAISSLWDEFTTWWNNDSTSTLPKVMVMALLLLVFISNIGWLLPVGILMGATYLAYLLVRMVVIQSTSGDSHAKYHDPDRTQYHPQAMKRKNQAKQQSNRPNRMALDRKVLAKRTLNQRVTELLGSLVVSALVAVVLSVILLPVSNVSYDAPVATWAPILLWMVFSISAGSWSILTLSKFWESQEEEVVFRRFWMLGIGLLLGLAALFVSQALFLDFHETDDYSFSFTKDYQEHYKAADGSLTIGSFMVYFAGLFFALRWWRMADPLRKTRLSVWSTIVCVLWGVMLNSFWPFAQPWGILMAGAVSIAVQLSAPWVSPKARDANRQAAFPEYSPQVNEV